RADCRFIRISTRGRSPCRLTISDGFSTSAATRCGISACEPGYGTGRSPSTLCSPRCCGERRRTRRSLGEGGPPQRELTLTRSRGFPDPRLRVAAGAPHLPDRPHLPLWKSPQRGQQLEACAV